MTSERHDCRGFHDRVRAEGNVLRRVRGGNRRAEAIGRIIAERLKEKGITRVVFDRGGNLYHGRVRAVAEAARAAGLDF